MTIHGCGINNFVILIYINKLAKYEQDRGLPKINYKVENLCDDCQIGKLKKSTFKSKNNISTKQPLELLHLYLFVPTQVVSPWDDGFDDNNLRTDYKI